MTVSTRARAFGLASLVGVTVLVPAAQGQHITHQAFDTLGIVADDADQTGLHFAPFFVEQQLGRGRRSGGRSGHRGEEQRGRLHRAGRTAFLGRQPTTTAGSVSR